MINACIFFLEVSCGATEFVRQADRRMICDPQLGGKMRVDPAEQRTGVNAKGTHLLEGSHRGSSPVVTHGGR